MVDRLGKALLCVLAVSCVLSTAATAKVTPHSTRVSATAAARRAAGKKRSRKRCATTRRRTAAARRRGAAKSHRRTACPAGTTARALTKSRGKARPPVAYADDAPVRHVSHATQANGAPASWSAPASHVETWAYDDCANGGANAGTSLVRSWVTDAETNCGPSGDTKALQDCHSGATTVCDVIQYLDTNWIYPNGSPTWPAFSGAASEDWYQHTPGSTSDRIQAPGSGGGYLINQSNPAVQSWFGSYARQHFDRADGLMMDDQSTGLSTQLYYATCGCDFSDELSSDAALRSAHEAMSTAMTHANGQPFLQVDNTLPVNPYLPQGFDLLNQSSGVDGLIAEGEPERDGTLDPYYSTLLDQIAYVSDETSSFVVPLSYSPAGASYQPQSRRVQEATILLGYSPGHIVDWADLETGSSDLAVWPEEGIYPTKPVQSMGTPGGSGCLAGTGRVCSTGGHVSLQVAPGVYRREFGACYDRGASFGACAAIVNTTDNPVTIKSSWLTQTYAHQITTSGGDVQSGGSVNLTGAGFTPNSSTVAPHDAALLAR